MRSTTPDLEVCGATGFLPGIPASSSQGRSLSRYGRALSRCSVGDHGAPQTGDRLRRGRRFFCLRGQGYSRPTPKKVWRQFDTDDFAGGVIRFEDGAGLQIESFWASHQPAETQIELFRTDAGARLNPLTLYRTDPQGREEDLSISLPRSANIDA